MIRNKKGPWILASVLPALVMLWVVAAWADSQADERVVSAFSDVVASIAVPEQMHLVADVLITADGDDQHGPAWTTTASYTYWQDGDRFRVSAQVAEPDTPLAGDFDVSWDGETFYLWIRQDDLLSLSTERPRTLPVSLPHPLMLSLMSISSNRDVGDDSPWIPASLHLDQRTSELRVAGSTLTAIPRFARTLLEPEPDRLRVELSTGRSQGEQLRDAVKLARRDGNWLVEEIRRFDASGSPLSELRFGRFRTADGDVGGRLYPTFIDLQVAAVPGERSSLRSTFAVKELTLNAPIDPGVFDLTREDPKRIWDSDAEIFLR